MKSGLYEEIISTLLSQNISESAKYADIERLDVSDSHDYLAQYLYKVLANGLAQIKPASGLSKEKDKQQSKLDQQIAVCNEIINVLTAKNLDSLDTFTISHDASRLLCVLDDASKKTKPPRPDTPLALGSLLTGTRQDPSLISQIQKEIATADQIDMLVSFIKWKGIQLLKEQLIEFTKNPENRLRVITTSYMGATDLKAVEWLQQLPNTEIKVSYDTHRTRLHAKAYCFERKTGFSTAYVGSANLSHAALTDGLEWTVKVSQYEQPYQWEKIIATFETY